MLPSQGVSATPSMRYHSSHRKCCAHPLRPQPIWGPPAVCVGGLGEGWRGCTLSASRFRAVQRLDSKGRTTGCRTAEFDNAVCELARTVVEGVHVDHASTVVVSVRPSARAPSRCGRRSSGYGRGAGRRRRASSQSLHSSTFHQSRSPTDPVPTPRSACHSDRIRVHGPESLIALELLALGSHPPRLPGRN